MAQFDGPNAAANAAKALNLLDLELPKLRENAVRAALNSARNAAVKYFMSRGVGRRIWGGGGRFKKDAKSVRRIINRVRLKKLGASDFETGLHAHGMAALVETGGRTKAHTIRGRRGLLKFQGPEGTVYTRVVNHPGSQMQRDPYLERAVPVLNREYPSKLESGIERFKRKLKLE